MHLVIIGFGYSASAIARETRPLLASLDVTARTPEKVASLQGAGIDAHVFDGTALPDSLGGALDRATHLLVSAPPDATGDPLLRLAAFGQRALPRLARIAYLSTVGVYGDHDGAWVDESAELRPVSQRSRQRVAAEAAWRNFADGRGLDLGIFRLSGIYGPARSPFEKLRAGTARRIVKPGQVFNRIHVADIAGAVGAALVHRGPLGIYNLTDDEPCPPQDVVTRAAGLLGMAPPPEVTFEAADLSPMGRSFYGENKRVSNAKLKRELSYDFRCPTYREGLAACLAAAGQAA